MSVKTQYICQSIQKKAFQNRQDWKNEAEGQKCIKINGLPLSLGFITSLADVKETTSDGDLICSQMLSSCVYRQIWHSATVILASSWNHSKPKL